MEPCGIPMLIGWKSDKIEFTSIYLSLHRVPKDVGSMNKISPSIPILSNPIILQEGAAINDIIFPSRLPCLLVPGTISLRMRLGRHMLLTLQT